MILIWNPFFILREKCFETCLKHLIILNIRVRVLIRNISLIVILTSRKNWFSVQIEGIFNFPLDCGINIHFIVIQADFIYRLNLNFFIIIWLNRVISRFIRFIGVILLRQSPSMTGKIIVVSPTILISFSWNHSFITFFWRRNGILVIIVSVKIFKILIKLIIWLFQILNIVLLMFLYRLMSYMIMRIRYLIQCIVLHFILPGQYPLPL